MDSNKIIDHDVSKAIISATEGASLAFEAFPPAGEILKAEVSVHLSLEC